MVVLILWFVCTISVLAPCYTMYNNMYKTEVGESEYMRQSHATAHIQITHWILSFDINYVKNHINYVEKLKWHHHRIRWEMKMREAKKKINMNEWINKWKKMWNNNVSALLTHTHTQWRPMTDDSKYNFIEKPNEKQFFN